jgi:hypothetical protein
MNPTWLLMTVSYILQILKRPKLKKLFTGVIYNEIS